MGQRSRRLLALAGLWIVAVAAVPAQSKIPEPVRRAQQRGLELRLRAKPVVDTFALSEGQWVAAFGMSDPEVLKEMARRVGEGGRFFTVYRRQPYYESRGPELVAEFGRRVWPVFALDGEAHLVPGSLDRVVLIDQGGFFRNPEALYRQVAAALRDGGKLTVLRDPRLEGQETPGPPGPAPSELLPMQALGFELAETPSVLTVRQIWVFDFHGKP